jgi:hypothetical protein
MMISGTIPMFFRRLLRPFRFFGLRSVLTAVFAAMLTGFPAFADNEEQYIRIMRDDRNVVTSLETAVVRFRQPVLKNKPKAKPVTVDLIGAVHIGDKEYYEKLNGLFSQYEVVLYELVTNDPSLIPSPEQLKNTMHEKKNSLSAVQDGMAGVLKLEHQLSYIDYTKKNMIHADMSAGELYKRMFEEGEFVEIIKRAFLEGFTQDDHSAKTQGRFLASFFIKDRSLGLKRAMAMEITEGVESQLFVIDGEGSAMIAERNGIALKKLREQINAGKRKIAIFYGSAHLYHFRKCLTKDFGMKQTQTDWIQAWDMSGKKKPEK